MAQNQQQSGAVTDTGDTKREAAAFITSKDTLDGVYPGVILGINSLRLGMDATVFYTFMGINVIRKGWAEKAKFQPPGFMGALPGMSNVATWMMKGKMEKANIPSLPDLQEIALLEGVKFVACKMTVDMMELKQDDFIEGVTIMTAEDFLKYAKDCKVLLYT
ncbi:MAG: DsrE/DsrF/DrsH-like family protein [Gammaproteobacteria bacterium]|nr:DsrE/DsrF/DrsH-like family protein [Gammaproteobacteria bacterium]